LAQENKTTILLIASGSEMIALEVDNIAAEQELVIKPFGRTVAPPSYLYGCAILGDGSLVPVIDGEVLLAQWQETEETSGLPLEGKSQSSMPLLPMDAYSRSILVVDDSLTTRQNVTLTLQKFGYQVIQAGDGREALDQLKAHPQIKAVVSDVEMPNMNGFEFLSACRKNYSKEQLPVIMLTSRSGSKHQKIAQVLGANHYLTKPYLEQDLRGALERCLEAVPC
jgi:chemotaxis family two-component system sensor histidine kinase/response regulator PixL